MKKEFLFTACLTLALYLPPGRAQSISPGTLNASGGSKLIGTDTYEWSIGEMALVSTATRSNIIVTQGLLQPVEGTTGIGQNNRLNELVTVYPNPSSGLVYLDYTLPASGKLGYVLQDITGKQIAVYNTSVKPGKGILQVDLKGLANATYMLYISYVPADAPAEQTSFKIDKLN